MLQESEPGEGSPHVVLWYHRRRTTPTTLGPNTQRALAREDLSRTRTGLSQNSKTGGKWSCSISVPASLGSIVWVIHCRCFLKPPKIVPTHWEIVYDQDEKVPTRCCPPWKNPESGILDPKLGVVISGKLSAQEFQRSSQYSKPIRGIAETTVH